jgi:Flp pilus assembly CpaE family ATPase
LDLAKLSDDVVLVTTTELAAVYAAKRWLSHLGANGVARSKLHLVISRWRREVGFHPEEVETALGLKVLHILPSDPQSFADALIEGRPVAPGSLYGKSVAEFTSQLLDSKSPAARSSPRRNLLSLFSRGAG